MGKIRRVGRSDSYVQLEAESKNHQENNDCAVIALSVALGVPYAKVHKALAEVGRKNKDGTYLHQVEKAAELLGFKMERVPFKWQHDMIQTYPGGHKKAQHITTHHPRRFNKQWRDVEPLVFHVDRHFAGFRDGQIHDWSVNKAKRVIGLYRFTKI